MEFRKVPFVGERRKILVREEIVKQRKNGLGMGDSGRGLSEEKYEG